MAEPPCEIGGSATGLSATGRLTHTAVGVGDPLGAAAASHRPGACKKSTHGRLFTGAISMPVTCVMGWAKEGRAACDLLLAIWIGDVFT